MMQLNELNYLGDCTLSYINAHQPLYHSGSQRHYNDMRRKRRDALMNGLYAAGLHHISDTGRDGRYNQSIKQLVCIVSENKQLAIQVMNQIIGDQITPAIVKKVVTQYNAKVQQLKKAEESKPTPATTNPEVTLRKKYNTFTTAHLKMIINGQAQGDKYVAEDVLQARLSKTQPTTTTNPPATNSSGSSTSQLSELVHSKYFIPVAAGAAGLILILLISR